MEAADKLHFFITGGTIDSYYDLVTGEIVPYETSSLPDFLKILKLYENYDFTTICMKDSRDLNDDDRAQLLSGIRQSVASRIIVTHGSFTVSDTAKYISSHLSDINKTIIFVCSMIPLKGFDPTDAGFNLGYAVAKSQDLQNGVFVCMNGRVFTAEEVTKILAEGRFGSIYTR